jgi:hypothetical protein
MHYILLKIKSNVLWIFVYYKLLNNVNIFDLFKKTYIITNIKTNSINYDFL